MNESKYLLIISLLLFFSVHTEIATGEVAVSLSTHSPDGWPNAGSNHGWEFTVNEEITLTHLGLYDHGDNGFSIDHPIGLWRLSDEALLASGTVSAGTGDTLIDHFRYIDVPDVDLSIDVDYVVGFYTDTDEMDKAIIQANDLQVNSAINLIVGRYDGAGQFQMPANEIVENPPDPYYPDRFGPNFQFIPEPATISLLALGGLLLRKRRSRS